MADLGLIGGLAKGLQSGVGAYQNTKRYNDEQDLKQQDLQLKKDLAKRQSLTQDADLMSKNMEINPDTGLVGFNAQGQQEKNLAGLKTSGSIALETPGTPELKAYQDAHKKLLNNLKPGLGDQVIQGNMTASQIDRMGALEKAVGTTNAQILRNQLMASLGGQRMELAQSRYGLMNDKASQSVLNQYDKKQSVPETQIANASRAASIIDQVRDGSEIKANKALSSDLAGILASMANQGRPPTVYGMSHQEFDSAQGRIMGLYNFVTGKSETTIAPAQLDQLKKDIHAMANEYALQHEKQHAAFMAGTPSRFKEPVQNRYDEYRKQWGLPGSPQGLVQGPPQGLVQGASSPTSPQPAQAPQAAPLSFEEFQKARKAGKI